MIVAGEASGDLHGAHLVAAMKQLEPNLSFCAMGGVALRDQGVEILYDAAKMAVVGLVEVVTHLKDILAARRILVKELQNNPPDLLILIDYPDFNLLLAAKAKKLGIPIFYYISPQVWAWRSGRVKKIGRLVDQMVVILPFEKDFYHARGVEVVYAGHPLVDSVKTSMSRAEFCRLNRINPDNRLIGMLPGSRKKEIRSMLPVFLQTAEKLAASHEGLTFLLPLAPTLTREDLKEGGLDSDRVDVQVISENRYDLMASCEAVMAASGTVTLELAILDVPMVVSYKVAPFTWFVANLLVDVDYASLVNLIVGRQVVPELLQDQCTPESISHAINEIFFGTEKREKMLSGLAEVRQKLGKSGASRRTAELALKTAFTLGKLS